MAAALLTGVLLGAVVDFLTVVGLTVFAFVVKALGLAGGRAVTLTTGFLAGTLAVEAFALVVAAFVVESFLAAGFVFWIERQKLLIRVKERIEDG